MTLNTKILHHPPYSPTVFFSYFIVKSINLILSVLLTVTFEESEISQTDRMAIDNEEILTDTIRLNFWDEEDAFGSLLCNKIYLSVHDALREIWKYTMQLDKFRSSL